MNQGIGDWDHFSDNIQFLGTWLQDSLLPHCFLLSGQRLVVLPATALCLRHMWLLSGSGALLPTS